MSPQAGMEDKFKITLTSNCLAIVLRRLTQSDPRPHQEASLSSSDSNPSAAVYHPDDAATDPPPEGKQTQPGPGPPSTMSSASSHMSDHTAGLMMTNGDHAEVVSSASSRDVVAEDGFLVFREFLQENSQCYWNPSLVECVTNLEYKGSLVMPITLLVSGTEYSLEVMRTAWARRVLRPPHGYDIEKLGDVAVIEMSPVMQTQFTPLSEAVCKAVYDLNSEGRVATIDFIAGRLHKCFPDMVVPDDDILCRSLGILIRERKLYHNGRGYVISTPETYRRSATLRRSTGNGRQMLMTNEEAIIRLHGNGKVSPSGSKHDQPFRSRAIQTNQKDILHGWKASDKILVPSEEVLTSSSSQKLERSHSLRLLRSRDRSKTDDKLNRSYSFKLSPSKSNSLNTDLSSKSDPEQQDHKKEKVSMLSKLFRRHHSKSDKNSSKTVKRATFSAQFPPVEWSDPDYVHFHSRGTQTIERDMFVSSKVRYGSLGRASGRDGRERHSCHIHSTPVHSPRGERRSRADQRRESSHRMSTSKSASLPRRSFAGAEAAEVVTRRKSSPKLGSRRHRLSDSLPSSGREYARKPEHRYSTRSEKLNNMEFFRHQEEAMKQLNITTNELQKGLRMMDNVPPSTGPSYPMVRLSAPLMSPYMDETTLRNLRSPPLRDSTDRTKLLNSGHEGMGIDKPGYSTPIKIPAKPQNVVTTSSPAHPPVQQQPELEKSKLQRVDSKESLVEQKKTTTFSEDLTVGSTVDVAIEISPDKEKSVSSITSTDPIKKVSTNGSKQSGTGSVWSHTVSTKTQVGQCPKTSSVRTATTITTSLSHGALKSITSTTCSEKPKSKSANNSPLHSVPILELKTNGDLNKGEFLKDPDAPVSPIRKKMADAKAAFFANGTENVINHEQLFFPPSGQTVGVGGSK